MTTTAGASLAHDPSAGDMYDPDEVFPQNSPLMKPYRPKLEPSPSPPAVTLPQVSLSLSPGRKSSNGRRKIQPSRGDAVLIYHLDGGKHPEIATEAGFRPLTHAHSEDGEDQCGSDTEDTFDDSGDEEEDIRSNEMSPVPAPAPRPAKTVAKLSGPGLIDLRFLAASATNALAAAANSVVSEPTDAEEPRRLSVDARVARRAGPLESLVVNGTREEDVTMKDTMRPVLAAPISPYPSQGSQELYSPRQHPLGQVLMHPNDVRSPTSLTPGGHGDLPPIQVASPQSDTASHDTLPPIRSHLFEQLSGPAKDIAMRNGTQFPHSPPAGPPRMGGLPIGHSSPPISPNEVYRHSMPSPAQTIPGIMSPYYYSSASSTSHHRSGPDYSSSNTETPNTEVLTPATSITDRMSIDNMTNPQVGQFICTFHGCNAQPFQTQYLLNSHANVHSSARPHYCSVRGCPRSEGGKGFKRKNEMIRHGLVHDSPGYVCPFCPDREHKYPRPDNLQRYVRHWFLGLLNVRRT
ncbi:Uu.00g080880.m01.CDS01 [Anthostomella pinea]|uniref:Uu.00g080880.m01.CDS01 n=1 Tax=Anthostomella pinea TaxID=933095 RepID=A0AAI8YJD8_9PEZI|nr:Uu.00g080880.m01.CDS01 [Anthostomella pinea]